MQKLQMIQDIKLKSAAILPKCLGLRACCQFFTVVSSWVFQRLSLKCWGPLPLCYDTFIGLILVLPLNTRSNHTPKAKSMAFSKIPMFSLVWIPGSSAGWLGASSMFHSLGGGSKWYSFCALKSFWQNYCWTSDYVTTKAALSGTCLAPQLQFTFGLAPALQIRGDGAPGFLCLCPLRLHYFLERYQQLLIFSSKFWNLWRKCHKIVGLCTLPLPCFFFFFWSSLLRMGFL